MKIKTYTIKVRDNGKLSYRPLRKIYAANWWEACEEFRKWALGWLDESSSDNAANAMSAPRKDKHPAWLWWDGKQYTIAAKGVIL